MKRRGVRILLYVVGTLVVLATAVFVVYSGAELEGPGRIEGQVVPSDIVFQRGARQQIAHEAEEQILFGDLHVHTTYSLDAFARSLPMFGGEGAHPPGDACDFARYCSQLDFFSLNDHAEALTYEHWQETKASVRQCNALTDPENPDLVAFTGFEWTQVGTTVEEHYGHKNVIFRDTEEDKLPKRPIAAAGFASQALRGGGFRPGMLLVPLIEYSERERYLNMARLVRELRTTPACPEGVDTTKISPERCREEAATPQVLFEKLAQWGFENLVIPHGTTWGLYTPPGYVYDKQLDPAQNHPSQNLIEVYSGHGNSEEHRPWRAVEVGPDGQLTCPEPTGSHEACCWRAGEIVRAACDASPEECERRVVEARNHHANAGAAGHHTIPHFDAKQWLNCDTCEDCFLGTFNHRPGGSVQYILAKGHFEDGKPPAYAPMGFIGSSDVHTARPGTGYKEVARRRMTDTSNPRSKKWRERLANRSLPGPPPTKSVAATPRSLLESGVPPFLLPDFERAASFFTTGGLVAVHSKGRKREAIWDALKRRQVYATSGERILLWFDVVNAPGGEKPMGSDVRLGVPPKFRVRAAGAFEQLPGCPDWAEGRLSKERMQRLCVGECYNPSDQRRRITRIEVVRIRPQIRADEKVTDLIEDVWKTIPCAPGETTCVAEFEDPTFVGGARTTYYYVRAIQEPTPIINAGQLRCDDPKNCTKVNPCYADSRTPLDDECHAEGEERAWSSPIFVHFDAQAAEKAAQEAAAAEADAGAPE